MSNFQVDLIEAIMAAVDEDEDGHNIRNGYALILNHTTFDNKKVHARPDIKKDVLNLQSTLERLHFTVDLLQDGTHDTIMSKIQNVACDKKLKGCDCLMIVVMTHGNTFGQLLSKTSQYFIHELMEPFVEEIDSLSSAAGLTQVPKVFLIQACHFTGNNLIPPAQLDDVLLLHSTIEGCEFVQSICKALQSNHLYRTDLHTIVKRINNELSKLGTESGNIDNTLRQRLYFECSAQPDVQPNAQSHIKYVQDALFFAAKRDNIEMFKYLLDSSNRSVEPSETKSSLLHIACKNGNDEMVSLLLDQKNNADINLLDDEDCSPILYAIQKGSPEMVKKLIENGADFNVGNSDGEFLLYVAVKKQYVDVVKMLVERGANVAAANQDGTTAMWYALEYHMTLVQDVLMKVKLTKQRINAGLLQAAWRGHLGIVKYALQNGANIGARTSQQANALNLAVACGHTEIVKVLLQHGAKVNSKSVDGCTPLHLVAREGHSAIATLLLQQKGIEVNATTQTHSATPLHLAAVSCYPNAISIVKQLVEHGANIYATDALGRTPMSLAIERKTMEIVKYFANLTIANCVTT